MVSAIDPTKPTAGTALTADVRANFQAAKTEIEALQSGKQPLSDRLTALVALTLAANKLIYATSQTTFDVTDFTAFARSLLVAADAAAARTILGAASTTALTGKQDADATLTALAALTTAANKLIYATGVDTFATADLTTFARTLLDDPDAATALATLGAAAAGHTHTAAADVYAAVKLILAQGTNVTVTANDTAKTLTVAASGGSGSATSFVVGILSKSGNYATTLSDNKYLVRYTTAATHTLLAAATAGVGFTQIIKAVSGSVSIAAAAGETVNNTSAYSLAQGTSALIVSDGVSAYELVLMPAVTTASASTCTWNPADVDASMTLSNGNLTIACSTGGIRAGRANKSISSGNYYYEFGTVVADGCQIGWATSAASNGGYLGQDANGWCYASDGKKWNSGTGTTYGATWNAGTHRIGVFVKSTATNVFSIWIAVDGVVQGGGDPVAGTSPMFSGVTGPLFPAFGDNSGTSAAAGTAYFTAASWMYVPATMFAQIP